MCKVRRGVDYILTAGKSEEIRDIAAECEYYNSRLQDLLDRSVEAEKHFKARIARLACAKKRVYRLLRKTSVLLGRATSMDVEAIRTQTPIKLAKEIEDISLKYPIIEYDRPCVLPLEKAIDGTIDHFNSALAAAKGTAVGTATGLGSWALVSAFGTASTGTAIGGLSGIAAHNAAMAWFGGGALAVGGGGMAVGVFVLGGIVALPVLVTTIAAGYKKANRRANELRGILDELRSRMDICKRFLQEIDPVAQRADSIYTELNRSGTIFEAQLQSLLRRVYPFNIFSRLWRSVRCLATGHYFAAQEIASLVETSQTAMIVIALMDRPLFEIN
jgi:hypothetical protein